MAQVIRSPALRDETRRLTAPGLRPAAAEAADAAPDPLALLRAELEERIAAEGQRAEEAESRLAEIEAELEALRESARQEGREAGLLAGEREGRASAEGEHREQHERLRACIDALEARTHETLESERDAIAEAVFAAVVQLLGDGYAERRGIEACVRRACEQVASRERLELRLAPDDLALVSTESLALDAGSVRLEADPSVGLGGCVIESECGSLDARLETQLQRLAHLLRRTRAERAQAGTAEGDATTTAGEEQP